MRTANSSLSHTHTSASSPCDGRIQGNGCGEKGGRACGQYATPPPSTVSPFSPYLSPYLNHFRSFVIPTCFFSSFPSPLPCIGCIVQHAKIIALCLEHIAKGKKSVCYVSFSSKMPTCSAQSLAVLVPVLTVITREQPIASINAHTPYYPFMTI